MDWTRIRHWATRIRVIVSAWPPAGALFLLLSFVVTALWLYEGLFVGPDEGHGWLEPLAAILAGLGSGRDDLACLFQDFFADLADASG